MQQSPSVGRQSVTGTLCHIAGIPNSQGCCGNLTALFPSLSTEKQASPEIFYQNL
jgi:hypothetical protein